MNRNGFIITKEYLRFSEFAQACTTYRYIGVCHGTPGVGKTVAAVNYSQWDEEIADETIVHPITAGIKRKVKRCKGVLVTAPVINTPKIITQLVYRRLMGYGFAMHKAAGEKDELEIAKKSAGLCPLLLVDEAERLQVNTLEQLRHIYDELGFGLVLIGMPGIEKRLSRYPQLYSRIGFSHEFCHMKEDEMRFIFEKKWAQLGSVFNTESYPDIEATNTIIRITGGNFRLIDRLFSQIKRIQQINKINTITSDVVEAARKCLLIGE